MAITDRLLGTLKIRLGVDTSGLNVARTSILQFREQTEREMNRVSAQLERTSNQFQRFGSAANRYLTLPLTLIGGGAIKMASDLEYANQKIVALAGVSQEQVNAWDSASRRISASTATSRKQIAETLYYVASAGIETKEALEITEMSAKAAAVGLGRIDIIGRLLTYAMNAYGTENINAAKAMDALTIAVREGTAEADTMVGVIGDLIPVGSALGVQFDEIVGSVAAMTRTGFNAAKSATALRQIMVSLLHPIKGAEDALDQWSKKLNDASYSAEGLRKTMRDEGLFEALVKVNNLVNTFGDEATGIVFGNVRALTGDLSLTGKNIDKVREVLKQTKDEVGAFDYAFQIMTQTTKFGMDQVKIAMQNAFIDLGNAMLSPVLDMMRYLSSAIKELSTAFRELPAWIQSSIVSFGAMLIAVGPLSMAIAGAIKIYAGLRVAVIMTGEAIAWSAAALQLAVAKMLTVLKALRAAWIMNPELVLMIGAVVAALGLAYVMYQKLKTKTVELSAAQKVLNDVNRQAALAVVDERIQIEKLISIVKSEYTTKEMKAGAIKSLNAISPKYLGFIDEEAIKTGRAKEAIDAYIGSLKERARQEAAYQMWVKLNKDYMDAEINGTNRHVGAKQFSQTVGPVHALGTWIMDKVGLKENAQDTKTFQELGDRNAQAAYDTYIQKTKQLEGIIYGSFSNATKLNDEMAALKITMTDLSKLDVKALNYNSLSDLSKRIEGQLKAEQNYTEKIKAELQKRLSADLELQSLKQQLDEANANHAASAFTANIYHLIDIRRQAIAQEYQMLYNSSMANIGVLQQYFDFVEGKMKLVKKPDLGLDDKGKVKTLKQKLAEIMEQMMTASGQRLINLSKEYVKLDELIKKQEKLVDLTVARTRYENDLKNTAKVELPSNATAADIKLQIGTDDEKLKKLSEYMDALAKSSIFAGAEVEKVQGEIAKLTLNKINNSLTLDLMTVGSQAEVLGTEFDAAGAKIELYNSAIENLSKAYAIASQSNVPFVNGIIRQSIALMQNKVHTLTLEQALKKLNDSKLLIANTEEVLGLKFDSFNEEIRAQEAFLQVLNAEYSRAKEAHEDYSATMDKINNTKATITTLSFNAANQKLEETLQDISLHELNLGRSYDDTSKKIEAQETFIESLIETLKFAQINTGQYVEIQKSIGSATEELKFLKLAKNIEDYVKAMQHSNIVAQIQGRHFNKEIADIENAITFYEALLDVMIEYGEETEDVTKILANLYNQKRKAERKEEMNRQFIQELKQIGTNAIQAMDATQGLKDVMGSMVNVGDAFMKGGLKAGIASIVNEAIGLFGKMAKHHEEMKVSTQQYYIELLSFQIEYNNLLNEQMKLQSDSVFVTDYADQINKAISALKANQGNLGKALTLQVAAPRTTQLFTKEYESVTSFISETIIKTGREWNKLGTESWNTYDSILKVYPELLNQNGTLNIGVAKLIAGNDELWTATNEAQRRVMNNLISWSEQNEKNIEDLRNAVKGLTGDIGGDMFSSMYEAWKKGEDAFSSFKTTVSDGLRDIQAQMLWNTIFKSSLDKLQNDLIGVFDPLTGSQDPTSVFEAFLNGADAKVNQWTSAMSIWETLAKSKGFTFTMAQAPEAKEAEKLIDPNSISNNIFEGLQKGFKLGYSTLDDFGNTFSTIVSDSLKDSFVKSMANNHTMNTFNTMLGDFMKEGSEGGIGLVGSEIPILKNIMHTLITESKALYDQFSPMIQQLEEVAQEKESLFKMEDIANTIYDGIEQGLELGNGALGDFSEGFAQMMSTALRQQLVNSITDTINSGFLAKYNAFIGAGSEGGTALTSNEVLQLEQLYTDAIRQGEDAFKAVKPILDKYKAQTEDQMVGAVKGMTLDQASLLAGQLTGMRYDLRYMGDYNKRIVEVSSQTNELQFQSLSQLKDIASNTRRTNEVAIPELVSAVRETNSLIKTLWQ